MFTTLQTAFLMLGLVSTLAMFAACFVVGHAVLKTAARHPVAVAEVLGRSGRVRLGIIAAGAIGVFIAWLADFGLPAEADAAE